MEEIPALVEQNDTMIHEIQHIPYKSDQKEIKKLQEKDPHYTKLLENMKLKNERSKGNCNLGPLGKLYKKVKDHGRNLECQ